MLVVVPAVNFEPYQLEEELGQLQLFETIDPEAFRTKVCTALLGAIVKTNGESPIRGEKIRIKVNKDEIRSLNRGVRRFNDNFKSPRSHPIMSP